jgi:hypothetical protein
VWSRPPAQAALFVREGARRRCCVPSRCFLDRQQSCRALPLPLCVPQRVLSGPLADIWQRPFVTNSWAATGSYSNLFDDGVLWNVYEFLSPLPVDYDDKVAGQIARDHRGELEAQLPVPPPPPPLSLSPLLRALCLPRGPCGGPAYVPSPCCCAQRVDGNSRHVVSGESPGVLTVCRRATVSLTGAHTPIRLQEVFLIQILNESSSLSPGKRLHHQRSSRHAMVPLSDTSPHPGG